MKFTGSNGFGGNGSDSQMQNMLRMQMMMRMMQGKGSTSDAIRQMSEMQMMQQMAGNNCQTGSAMPDSVQQMMLMENMFAENDSNEGMMDAIKIQMLASENIDPMMAMMMAEAGGLDDYMFISHMINNGHQFRPEILMNLRAYTKKDFPIQTVVVLRALMDMDIDKINDIFKTAIATTSDSPDLMMKLLTEKNSVNSNDHFIIATILKWKTNNNGLNLTKMLDILHNYKSEVTDSMSTMVRLLELDGVPSEKKKAKPKADPDPMVTLKDSLDNLDSTSLLDMATTIEEADLYNKRRDDELVELKKEFLYSVIRKLDALLNTTDGQSVVRNILRKSEDDMTTKILMRLNDRGIEFDHVKDAFTEIDGVYKVSKSLNDFVNDAIESVSKVNSLKSILMYDSIISAIEEGVSTLVSKRKADENEAVAQREKQEALEKQRAKELNASIVQEAIKELKASGIFEDIKEQIKKEALKTDD